MPREKFQFECKTRKQDRWLLENSSRTGYIILGD